MNNNLLKEEAKTITEWFHSIDEHFQSPVNTISQVSELFLKHMKKFHLELEFTERDFRLRMCEAMCVYRHAEMTNKRMKGPNRKTKLPKNWKREAEEFWVDYLNSFVFSPEFWENVWSSIPVGLWEESVPYWRGQIQLIMPEYIVRDVFVLSEAGLMFEDSEGELIDAAEYDMHMMEENHY